MRRIITYLAAVAGLALVAIMAPPLAGASVTMRPAPSTTGSVALSGPVQYVNFAAFSHGRHHGWITYTNFTYPAGNSNVWNISGTHALVFAGTYAHTMNITTITPLSPQATRFSGTGSWNADPSYTWTVRGMVRWNAVSFSITYTGTNAGYWVRGHGLIAADGSVSGTAVDSNGQKLPFTMPAGSAFQVLSYHAAVMGAVIRGHDARFEFTIPAGEPAGLAGLPIVVKVHDGGFRNGRADTYGHGAATSWCNGTVTQYPITSGNIAVQR
jgi:hypothetical protein